MSEWQPIETAPKDGTAILGYAFYPLSFGGGRCAVVYWDGDEEEWDLVVKGSYAEDGIWMPEYWMPLPAPPEKPHD